MESAHSTAKGSGSGASRICRAASACPEAVGASTVIFSRTSSSGCPEAVGASASTDWSDCPAAVGAQPSLPPDQRTTQSTQRKAAVFDIYEMIEQLNIDLGIGLYQPSPYRVFVVREPKIREIFAPSFRDRLVHHLIVDRMMPLVDRRLMDESYANRPWKGAHRAVKRLQQGMRRMPHRFVKHQLKAPHYARYVDDFVLLAESPEQLQIWRQEIEDFLRSRLTLTLHPQKTLVQPIHRGWDFLGFVVRPPQSRHATPNHQVLPAPALSL